MANNFDPFNPQWWANGTLAILNENLVAMRLFNKDYSDMFARGGDVVNTRRPNRMTADRKAKASPIVNQDVSAENVPVKLDQHIYNSFLVHDLDKQYSAEDLVGIYVRPAGQALAKQADRTVTGQAARWAVEGYISGDPSQRVIDNIIDGNAALDAQLAPPDNHNLILNTTTSAKLLKDRDLLQVNTSGSGNALRNGEVGRLIDTDLYKSQNMPQTASSLSAQGTVTLTLTADATKGSTAIVANQGATAIVAGDYLKIGDVPYKVISVAGGADPRTFTLSRPLHKDFAVGAKAYANKGTTLAASYAAGFTEAIVLAPTGTQYIPRDGDFLDIKGKGYAVIKVEAGSKYTLDRPLEDAVTVGVDLVHALPSSGYSFLSHPDCLTIAVRPLALTPPGTGVRSAFATFNGLTVRCQMGYNMTTQNMQVTMDFLMGVSVLDMNLATVLVAG